MFKLYAKLAPNRIIGEIRTSVGGRKKGSCSGVVGLLLEGTAPENRHAFEVHITHALCHHITTYLNCIDSRAIFSELRFHLLTHQSDYSSPRIHLLQLMRFVGISG